MRWLHEDRGVDVIVYVSGIAAVIMARLGIGGPTERGEDDELRARNRQKLDAFVEWKDMERRYGLHISG